MQKTIAFTIAIALTANAQIIETEKLDRHKVIRVETAPNHLSIIELAEPVTEVAAGSSSYKIEWRGNKVFVQPGDYFPHVRAGRLGGVRRDAGCLEHWRAADLHEVLAQLRSRSRLPRHGIHVQGGIRSAVVHLVLRKGRSSGEEEARHLGESFCFPPHDAGPRRGGAAGDENCSAGAT